MPLVIYSCCCMLVLLVTAGQTAPAPGGALYEISSELISRLDADTAERLQAARTSSPETIRAMLRDSDPVRISLGLDAAMYQCRPDLLVEAAWLLDDARPALPKARIDPATGEAFIDDSPRTISGQYRLQIHFWMNGLPWETRPLQEALKVRADPWAEVNPWRIRLQSLAVQRRHEELIAAKTQFEKSPETVRWIVVVEPQTNPRTSPAFSEEEVKTILDSLSADTKHRIADRSIGIPSDYQSSHSAAYITKIFQRYDELTSRSLSQN